MIHQTYWWQDLYIEWTWTLNYVCIPGKDENQFFNNHDIYYKSAKAALGGGLGRMLKPRWGSDFSSCILLRRLLWYTTNPTHSNMTTAATPTKMVPGSPKPKKNGLQSFLSKSHSLLLHSSLQFPSPMLDTEQVKLPQHSPWSKPQTSVSHWASHLLFRISDVEHGQSGASQSPPSNAQNSLLHSGSQKVFPINWRSQPPSSHRLSKQSPT